MNAKMLFPFWRCEDRCHAVFLSKKINSNVKIQSVKIGTCCLYTPPLTLTILLWSVDLSLTLYGPVAKNSLPCVCVYTCVSVAECWCSNSAIYHISFLRWSKASGLFFPLQTQWDLEADNHPLQKPLKKKENIYNLMSDDFLGGLAAAQKLDSDVDERIFLCFIVCPLKDSADFQSLLFAWSSEEWCCRPDEQVSQNPLVEKKRKKRERFIC